MAGDSYPVEARRRTDVAGRNRRTLRVLLAILAALALTTLLVGIRW